jgi:biopolymer transport protein ExbD
MLGSALSAVMGLVKQADEPDASQEFSSTSIFVTPMLDMAFQLLAFFIFTYHPSALEGQFPISMAQSEGGGDEQNPQRPDQRATPQKPTETKPTVTVTARADATGRLVGVEVAAQGKTEPIRNPNEEKETDPKRYETRIDYLLRQLQIRLRDHKEQSPKEDRLLLRGSLGLKWEDAMKVLDACRRYKATNGDYRDLFPKVEMDLIR